MTDLTSTFFGLLALALFVLAYGLVAVEERLHLRKSKPVILAAGIIWILVAITFAGLGERQAAAAAIRHYLLEYAELFLFLLSAMTYINSMEERNVFLALHSRLAVRGFSLRTLFWITGLLAFLISPMADNLTTALFMGAVVMAVGKDNPKFVAVSCINIVVAANAGGAFSPFGDITTLMVWQKGKVEFWEFFAIFLPALVNWLVPAIAMSFAVEKRTPAATRDSIAMKLGAKRIILLFLLTICSAVFFHNFLQLPPAAGMMLGFGYLGFFSHFLKKREQRMLKDDNPLGIRENGFSRAMAIPGTYSGLMREVSRVEWDTLLFFYGVILCVGGLSQFGYLTLLSGAMYHGLGPTLANVVIGVLSAVVDNIPMMFAVLTMDPAMSHGQWLLVTLTAGVGGSMLSIGSAAGVALMGTARGVYTFGSHLKWAPAIVLGYAASILCHLLVNRALM